MNREFIEYQDGTVACIVPAMQALPAPDKRIVKVPHYWCGFCQTDWDADNPHLNLSPNDGRVRCPNDGKRMDRETADIEVG